MKLNTILVYLLCLSYCSLASSQCQENCLIQPPASFYKTSCPSQDDVNTFHGNVREIIEKKYKQFSCGGAGWTRVAYLNMSDPQETCPSSLTLSTSPVRGCGRSTFNGQICDSVVYSVSGRSYSSVCGKVIAYHKRTSRGLLSVRNNISVSIEHAYVSGVSITHGPAGARQHVWTFVGTLNEVDNMQNGRFNCRCSNTNATWAYEVPSFMGNDYFCDTGNRGPGTNSTAFYIDDPLWDGEGCGSTSSCCEFNSPPLFYKSLTQPTTDDLEIRMCGTLGEDKIITRLEIYVSH